MTETNPLVESGEYERVYACELAPGDVIPGGLSVVDVESVIVYRGAPQRIAVSWSDGTRSVFRRETTVLVKTGA